MFFETAGVSVSPWLPPLVAFLVSFFTSIGGVSGAFLLLPFQMTVLGYTSPSVSATNQLFNIIAIPTGVYHYVREGRVVWPIVGVVIFGSLPGVFIGAVVRVMFLPDPKSFKFFVGLVLFYIGAKIIRELLESGLENSGQTLIKRIFHDRGRFLRTNAGHSQDGNPGRLPTVKVTRFDFKRLEYTFLNQQFDVSFWGIFAMSLMVGVVGGIYGIGGGSILSPIFAIVLKLPAYALAGVTLTGALVTSLAGVGFFEVIAPLFPQISVEPDCRLGILFGLGGMAGLYAGARFQKYIPANAIKLILAAIVILIAGNYIAGFISQ
ncbi:MAG: sulfite exporter TauE/SafE family protein [Desulfobacterales bacterium]